MDSQPSQSSGRFSVDQIHNSPKNSKLNSSSSLSKSLSKTISDTHSLSAILNNPQSNSDATWTSWWTPSSVEFAPINVSKAGGGQGEKLRLILNVNQALSALKLLVASADCAGALDITDDLQQLLDGDELTGLHCFRHLGDHVNGAIDSINIVPNNGYNSLTTYLEGILSAEFMRTSIQDTGGTDAKILVKSKARATSHTNGIDDDVKIDEEETSNIREQLLPLIIGLLRTAKLPTVLRLYRDTLTVEMKSAIKMVVSELLPVLASRPSDSDFTQGERVVDSDSELA
ncbi:Vacuolar protein sorting-associated protein 54 [Orobanche hederae]